MSRSVPAIDRPPSFDRTRCRFERDGVTVVHFSHLHLIHLVRLAETSGICDGAEIIRRTAGKVFHAVLCGETERLGVAAREDRWQVCRDLWVWCGLGELSAVDLSPDRGRVEMSRSQVDEGWLRTWGRSGRPINLLAQGFLAAAWGAVHQIGFELFEVEEAEGLACGAERSVFRIRCRTGVPR